MNFIVARLLQYLNEEEAFWVLCQILCKHGRCINRPESVQKKGDKELPGIDSALRIIRFRPISLGVPMVRLLLHSEYQ